MTLRVKTIEYAFPLSAAAVATAVARNFTQLAALAIPETTGRTFRSVILEVSCVDNAATAASVTAVLTGVALGAVAISTATVTQTSVNSGENQAFLWTSDVTAYFVTNYTGTTMTADARLTVTGISTINATAKLIITYEYDDAATTQIKTVRIPIDGNNGALTTAFTTVGAANQIPLLDEFLPEAGKVIRSYFFQMDVHTGTTAAATSALTMRYDGATSVADTSWGYSLSSDTFYRRIDVLTGLATSAAHTIEALVTSVTGSPFNCINGVLVVTYEHTIMANTTLNGAITNVATSIVVATAAWPAAPFTIQCEDEQMRVTAVAGATLTVTRGFGGTTAASHATGLDVYPTILNSIFATVLDEGGWVGGTVTGDKSRFKRNFNLQEPGLILLAQSGVQVACIDAGAVTVDIRAGAQASRVYTQPATARCGGLTMLRRIDAGSVGGVAAMTLARGRTDFVLDIFTTSATAGNIGANSSARLYLNYYSGQSAQGVGAHNHTTAWCILPYATGGLVRKKVVAAASTKTPVLPETAWYMLACDYELKLITSGTAAANLAVVWQTEVQAAEAAGGGWNELFNGLYSSDAEVGPSLAFVRARDDFKRWSTDPDTDRLNIETARDYRLDVNVSAALVGQATMWVTYNAITFSKVITVTGSGGGTVTVTVRWKSHDDGTVVWTGTRVGDGTVTATLFEDTDIKFTEARENDTLVGRSGDWT